jgi:hypothetical protein
LAQFYTATISEKLEARVPAMKKTFETLMAHQSEAYTVHQQWVSEHHRAGEVVRGAMIECRSNGFTDYEGFLGAIERFKKQIPNRRLEGGLPLLMP